VTQRSPSDVRAGSAGRNGGSGGKRPRPLLLEELAWPEAARRLREDPRILVPVGSLLQHGPHLPLGTDRIIVTRLAEEISRRHGVLTAPTIAYGAGSERDAEYAGSAPLSGKTLHRTLNELAAVWEAHGVEEFVFLTSHGHRAHLQALATVACETARVRAVDLHSVDLSDHLEGPHGREHAGELATSLVLHLAPDLVREDEIEDLELPPDEVGRLRTGEEPVPPGGSWGVVGRPSLASREKGERVFRYLVDFLGERVFAREPVDA
jgi:creatinine amidohydrolase